MKDKKLKPFYIFSALVVILSLFSMSCNLITPGGSNPNSQPTSVVSSKQGQAPEKQAHQTNMPLVAQNAVVTTPTPAVKGFTVCVTSNWVASLPLYVALNQSLWPADYQVTYYYVSGPTERDIALSEGRCQFAVMNGVELFLARGSVQEVMNSYSNAPLIVIAASVTSEITALPEIANQEISVQAGTYSHFLVDQWTKDYAPSFVNSPYVTDIMAGLASGTISIGALPAVYGEYLAAQGAAVILVDDTTTTSGVTGFESFVATSSYINSGHDQEIIVFADTMLAAIDYMGANRESVYTYAQSQRIIPPGVPDKFITGFLISQQNTTQIQWQKIADWLDANGILSYGEQPAYADVINTNYTHK